MFQHFSNILDKEQRKAGNWVPKRKSWMNVWHLTGLFSSRPLIYPRRRRASYRVRFSEAKMGSSSTVCEQIVEQLQNKSPWDKIVKTLNIIYSTYHQKILIVWRNLCAQGTRTKNNIECPQSLSVNPSKTGMTVSWKSLQGLRNT